MMSLRPGLSRPLWLMLFAVVLLVALGANRGLRLLLIPGELQYIPKESSLIVAIGDLGEVWERLEDSFGSALQDREREGILNALLSSTRDRLNKRGTPIRSAADLKMYGFDTDRGALFSAMDGRYVVVAPIIDADAVRGFLSKFQGAGPFPVEIANLPGVERYGGAGEDESEDEEEEQTEALYAAWPDGGSLVVSNSVALLTRSLLSRADNRRNALENDDLYHGVIGLLQWPLLDGPFAYAFWRPERYSAVSHVAAAAHFHETGIEVTADVNLATGRLRVIDQLGAPAPPVSDWGSSLPANTILAVAAQDASMVRYLDLAAGIEMFGKAMETNWDGLLLDLRDVEGLQRLVFALAGYRDGVPDLALGVWAPNEDLEKRVADLRVRALRKRDIAVLSAAVTRTPSAASAAELIAAGTLKPEPGGPLASYRLVDGRWMTADESRDFFNSARWSRSYKGEMIRFITPPLGVNDKELRSAFREVALETVLSDEYRIAAFLKDGLLWVATDHRVLEGLIDRLQGAPGLPDAPLFATGRAAWTNNDKLQFFVNIDEVSSVAGLNPDDDFQDIRDVLLDFEKTPSFTVAVRPGADAERMRLTWVLARSRGLE